MNVLTHVEKRVLEDGTVILCSRVHKQVDSQKDAVRVRGEADAVCVGIEVLGAFMDGRQEVVTKVRDCGEVTTDVPGHEKGRYYETKIKLKTLAERIVK